jgi:hypothetical protein
MRALLLGLIALTACTDPPPDPTGDEPVWTDGPAGHVYVYAGPLYDIDARDGRILRKITLDHAASNFQATADHAYFTKFDAGGNGRVFALGLDTDTPEQLGEVSNVLAGVVAGEVIGLRNGKEIVRTDLATGAVTKTMVPAGLECASASLTGSKLYLVCMRFAPTRDVGAIVHDLAAGTSTNLIVVKTGVQPLALASNITATPAGVVFVLYEGMASAGTRTAYPLDVAAGTVGAAVPLPGTSDDLDEQGAIGNTIFLTLFPSGQVLPFDVSTMTARAPIPVDRPRHLRTGGGWLWLATHGLDGVLARVDPLTGAQALRTFPPLEASGIDSLAYGGE